MTTPQEKQKELFDQKNWQAVANLGRVVKDNYDTKFNYAISMLVQRAIHDKDYMHAFELADKYQTGGGWNPGLVVVHLRNENGLDGQADRLFEEYKRRKAATSEESSSTQQIVLQ